MKWYGPGNAPDIKNTLDYIQVQTAGPARLKTMQSGAMLR
jgi:hypothetical protein